MAYGKTLAKNENERKTAAPKDGKMIGTSGHLVLLAVLLAAITACGKPAPGKPHPETPVAQTTRQEKTRVGMDEATQIANLIDPGKLATLRERGANPRIQKVTAILIVAKASGKNPEEIAREAVRQIGWGNTAKGDLTAAAILRNLDIAEKLGATTDDDIVAMRKGNAATVRRGPYTGDILSVDHVIPVAIEPALSNTIANLELMPLRLNQSKSDKIGDRQRDLAKKLHAAGLLDQPTLLK